MTDGVFGALIGPMVLAGLTAWLLRRWPGEASRRYPLPVAVALGFLFGLFWTHGWEIAGPRRHWQWLGWLALAAAILGSVSRADGLRWFDRFALQALLAILASWCLVPTWKEIEPVRPGYVVGLSLGLLVLTHGLEALPRWDRTTRSFLVIAALGVSGMIAAGVSLTYAQVAGMAAVSLLGAMIMGTGADGRAVATVYAVLIGGMAFVGFLDPRPPQPGLLLMAASPLALWLGEAGPIRRLTGLSSLAARWVPALSILLAGAIWAANDAGMLTR